jgi:hypothetical protein
MNAVSYTLFHRGDIFLHSIHKIQPSNLLMPTHPHFAKAAKKKDHTVKSPSYLRSLAPVERTVSSCLFYRELLLMDEKAEGGRSKCVCFCLSDDDVREFTSTVGIITLYSSTKILNHDVGFMTGAHSTTPVENMTSQYFTKTHYKEVYDNNEPINGGAPW